MGKLILICYVYVMVIFFAIVGIICLVRDIIRDVRKVEVVVVRPGEKKKMTNADRIRAMTDEELATELYLLRLDALQLEGFEGTIETKEEVLEWLKKEVEE